MLLNGINITVPIDPDAASWDKLIDEILNGNVIPVIGSNILYEEGDIHKILIQSIANACKAKSNPTSFSELVFDNDFLTQSKNVKDSIYTIINSIFKSNGFPSSLLLKEILGIRQFPFVITTSFTPIAENVMKEIWGEELRVMRFNNNPSQNDDIKSDADMRKPTIYYMFGKVGESAHRYALTDTDMLDYCSSWVADTNWRPRKIVAALRNKYLLMLGNNYSDWLFRFIWFSLRKEAGGGGLYCKDEENNDLSKFLERNHTFIQKSPSEVINKIKIMLEERLKEKERTKFDQVETNVDVFISYSRSDSEIVELLYERLTKMGKNVWYDKKNITHGGQFMEEIKNGIRSARYFVPILTHHIEEEKNVSHVYRIEWDEATQVAISLGRTYIIPVAEEKFDFYRASVPERIKQHNAIEFKRGSDLNEIAEMIIHKMNIE